MTRLFSVFATLLALVLVQVYAAFDGNSPNYPHSHGNCHQDAHQSFAIPDGHYEIILHGNLHLGLVEEGVGYPARLLKESSPSTVWKLVNDNNQSRLQNAKTGLFLAYDPKVPDFPVWMSKVPQPFLLNELEQDEGATQILTAKAVGGISMAVDQHPEVLDPPLVGLLRPSKDKSQAWQFRPISGLERDAQQYRFADD
ncbi:hypothetical protein BGZ73_004983 [Actinomortierella ambigua]|nr:hypothetical protein BGZ73_004983 [Actinomortierella ambigua]